MPTDLNFVEGEGIAIQVGVNPADPDITDVEIATTLEIPEASSPFDDTWVWMPLTTVVGGVPELVWEADDNLIPTLIPI